LNPLPLNRLVISTFVHTFLKKVGFETLHPLSLELPITLLGMGMDIFRNHTIIEIISEYNSL